MAQDEQDGVDAVGLGVEVGAAALGAAAAQALGRTRGCLRASGGVLGSERPQRREVLERGGIRHAAVLQVTEAKVRPWPTIRMVQALQGSARWKVRYAWPSRPHAPGC